MNPILQQPVFQVTLPVIVGMFVAVWMNNKAFDGVNKRLDDIIARLGRIEQKLDNHEERIVRVEERTSPFGRRG